MAYPFDAINKISSKTSLLPQAGAGALTGTAVDCQSYEGVLVSIKIGALGNADNAGTFGFEHSDDNSVWSDGSASLSSALPAINDTNKNAAYIRRYTGSKRYTRVNRSAITGTTAAAFVEADILRAAANREPVTQG